MPTKTVAEKLQVKPGTTVWSSHPEYVRLLGTLPDGVRTVDSAAAATTALVFAHDAASLRTFLAAHGEELTGPDTVWVAYPKANRADINRDSLWPILAEYGMRPIGQVALDEVWSAMRFRALREGEAPFRGGKG